MNRAVWTLATALVSFAAAAAPAQPGGGAAAEPAALRGDSAQTRKRLAEAEQKVHAGKAAEAADDLQRVLDESADDLVALDNNQYRSAAWVIHALLAKLPADALRAYQDRIDPPARKLLERAKRDRDPRPLYQLLDRYFVSRPAEDALVYLGELLFERGEFRAAEHQWRRLLPDGGADVAYPGAKADPVLTRARVALAVIFQDDPARAAAEVAAFTAKYPAAAGTLAGKTGPLADALRAALAARPALPPDAAAGSAWPTYGGGPDRAGHVPGGIPYDLPPSPTWAAPLPLDAPPINAAAATARPPFGYPVIADGAVYVTNGVRLCRFDLRTGAPLKALDGPLSDKPPHPAAQFTLTAAAGLLYARTGPAAVPTDGAATAIRCYCPGADRLTEQWGIAPPEESRLAVAWEGAPLVSGRRLWAVYAKVESGRVLHVLACYDPADGDRAPDRPAWVAELCDGPLPAAGAERTRHELLTLAGRHVVFCSNTGAVVAVDAITGRRAWGYRYPRAKKAPAGAGVEPTPAVYAGGRVYVAPADGNCVTALDAETGARVWESDPTGGARILGVSRDLLVVPVGGPVPGIRGLSLETGSVGGWSEADRVQTSGQGLVTDERVLWPTGDGLWFLRADTGLPERAAPKPLPPPPRLRAEVRPNVSPGFGHIAYADDTLVVVTPTQICAYRADPAERRPPPNPPPRERFDALGGLAERELAAGNTRRAIAVLAEMAKGDLPAPYRAWAAARVLQLAPREADPAQFAPAVRAALSPDLLAQWVTAPDGVPVTLETVLHQRAGRPAPAPSVPVVAPAAEPVPPSLTADAEIDHTLKLPPGVSPLHPIPGAGPARRLFAAGARAVVAVPLDRTAATEHPATDVFTHAADLATGFVAAGPDAVALYGIDRDPLWTFRVPLTDRLPTGPDPARFSRARDPDGAELSSFVLAGPWLFARVGEHHLIALDLSARRVAWVLNSAGRSGYDENRFPTAPRFGPHFAVTAKYVVAQLSDGRRWFVETRTGRPVAIPALGAHTARAWWPHAPVECGANRLLLADGPGLVRDVSLGGRVRWAYEPDRDDGLTGAPAGVWARGDVILIAVQRNHGVEIDRADAATGKSVWGGEPAFADAGRVDLTAADADAERAYIPAGDRLLALGLTTGKPAWEADLPGAGCRGWVVRAGKACLIAYPAEAVAAADPGAVWDRVRRSFAREPFVWRLPGLAATAYDTWVARSVPVLLLDPETGKRLARFDVPARGPAVAAHLGAGGAAVATGDRVVWIK
jgi:outer membrane protein assembly factor BamB